MRSYYFEYFVFVGRKCCAQQHVEIEGEDLLCAFKAFKQYASYLHGANRKVAFRWAYKGGSLDGVLRPFRTSTALAKDFEYFAKKSILSPIPN